MPVRIYDISKKLGLENKQVLAKAKELGLTAARVASSSLDKITAEYLEQEIIKEHPELAAPPPPPPPPPAPSPPAAPPPPVGQPPAPPPVAPPAPVELRQALEATPAAPTPVIEIITPVTEAAAQVTEHVKARPSPCRWSGSAARAQSRACHCVATASTASSPRPQGGR